MDPSTTPVLCFSLFRFASAAAGCGLLRGAAGARRVAPADGRRQPRRRHRGGHVPSPLAPPKPAPPSSPAPSLLPPPPARCPISSPPSATFRTRGQHRFPTGGHCAHTLATPRLLTSPIRWRTHCAPRVTVAAAAASWPRAVTGQSPRSPPRPRHLRCPSPPPSASRALTKLPGCPRVRRRVVEHAPPLRRCSSQPPNTHPSPPPTPPAAVAGHSSRAAATPTCRGRG